MNLRPVFIFGTHRSGSTTVERLLNCHPDLVIWGEHGGMLNHLLALDTAMQCYPSLVTSMAERGLDRFLKNKTATAFNPWRTTVSHHATRSMLRAWLMETFTRGLTARQRWGFKEIRYGGETIIHFLLDLFPEAQFLLLHRDLTSLCVSNILCEWSLKRLRVMGSFRQETEARQVVADCAYAIVAMEARLAASRRAAGPAAFALDIADLPAQAETIFAFLGLAMTGQTSRAAADVLATRIGKTNTNRSLGLLDRSFIAQWSPVYLAEAQRSIAAQGLNSARLTAQTGPGQYCFLLGDHDMRGSGLSSMGWTL